MENLNHTKRMITVNSTQSTIKLSSNEFIRLNTREILYFKAYGNYCHLKTISGAAMLLTVPLKQVEQFLTGDEFERLHKSYLTNTTHVVGVKTGRKPWVSLVNAERIPISKTKINRVMSIFNP